MKGNKPKPAQKRAESEESSEDVKDDSLSEEGEEEEEGDDMHDDGCQQNNCPHGGAQAQRRPQPKNFAKNKDELLNTLLINIYNGKQPKDYIANYADLVAIFEQEKRNGAQLF